MRHLLTALLGFAMSGHVLSDEVADTDQVNANMAYVVLAPAIGVGEARSSRQVDLTLVCTDFARQNRRSHYYPKLDNFTSTVIVIPPGVCALDRIRLGALHSQVPPAATAFRAEPGRLNYPGDWPVRFGVGGFIEIPGRASVDVSMSGNTVRSAETEATVLLKFPKLASRLPLQYTKLVD